MLLRMQYARSGTDLGYAATRSSTTTSRYCALCGEIKDVAGRFRTLCTNDRSIAFDLAASALAGTCSHWTEFRLISG
eukprot:241405-Rhodomonas_salina.1